MENITKSIIYGNSYENRYGKFLPVCSSISDRTAIQSILDYLRETPHFRKYNRVAYAYRVQEIPIVFITEKKNIQSQHFDDFYSDETIEGSGEKLLHLLQKFNIRNVFIGILIQQYNPLLPFQTTNYRAIVQNCRLLLDELYKKVVALQDHAEIKSFNDLLLHNNHTAKLKKCNIADTADLPAKSQKKLVNKRPNHIYSNGKPQFLINSAKNNGQAASTSYQIKFLWERCKLMKKQFEDMINSIDEKQIEQLRYYSMYDKNAMINQVFRLLTVYLGMEKSQLLNEFDFSTLKKLAFEVIDDKVLSKLDEALKSNKKLNADAVLKTNRPVGVLFCLIDLKIRFSKTLKRISQLMQKATLGEKEQLSIERSKKSSTSSFGTMNNHASLMKITKS